MYFDLPLCLSLFSRCGVLVDQNLKSLHQTLCSCFWYSDTVLPQRVQTRMWARVVCKSHGMTHHNWDRSKANFRNGLRPLQDNCGGHHLLHHHRNYYQHSHAWGAWEVCVMERHFLYRWPPSLKSMNGPQTHEGIVGKFFAHNICFGIFVLFAILLKH